MKQRDLLLGLGFLTAMSAGAVTSPFTGVAAPTEGEQDLYIYQVETGKWLQNNRHNPNYWHTRGALEPYGFDWKVKVVEGGYQLDPKFGHNHSMCANEGEGYYLDTNNDVCVWGLNPVTVDGVSNAYQIEALSGTVRDGVPFLLGESDGELSDQSDNTTWQLVTREERLQYMKDEVVAGRTVDATWLIPDPDFANANERDGQHIRRGNNDHGGGLARGGDDGSFRCNLVRECWNQIQNYQDFVKLEGIPNGTYRFRVQGYYRDYDGDSDIASFWEHYLNGTEQLRAEYFANDGIGTVMSITHNAPTEQPNDFEWAFEETTGIYIPAKMRAAARYFVESPEAYQNDWITCTVTDGTLLLGVQKRTADFHDWFIYDNYQLEYVSAAVNPSLTAVQAEVDALVAEANTLPMTPGVQAAIAVAEESAKTGNPAGLRTAALELRSLIGNVEKAAPAIKNFNLLKALCNFDTTEADEKFAAASTTADFNNALKHLRYMRRRHVAERQPDLFKGSEAVPGDYYLYNVGQQQFLIGGGDWGAHASLNLVGKLVTLETDAETADADTEARTYHINTYLNNGGESQYVNYAGYLDTGKAGKWLFKPVEGKENVYYIIQNDYQDAYWRWDMYASHSASDEGSVSTECRSPKFEDSLDDLNAQWKLVTKEERMALLENASLENPVDASFLIPAPGFNQRDNDVNQWSFSDNNFWIKDRGGNHMDHVAESWNTESSDLNCYVYGAPQGIYKVGVQGFYRYGNWDESLINDHEQTAAYFAAGDDQADDVEIMNIFKEANKAPGEGQILTEEDGTSYDVPREHYEAARFFRAGLYKNYTVIDFQNTDLYMGVYKTEALAPEDWIVLDNFRLTYYGNETTKEAVKEALAGIEEVFTDSAAEFEGDGRIYNLQGIRVANPTTPGIYIRNGKKFVVK